VTNTAEGWSRVG